MELKIDNCLSIKDKLDLVINSIPKEYKYKSNNKNRVVIQSKIFKCHVILDNKTITFKFLNIAKNKFFYIISLYLNNLNDTTKNKEYFKIVNLYKKYKGNDFYSLENVNLSFNKGEVIGLLGHNGAGKSTLIKSLVGQEEITKGNASVLGINNIKIPGLYKSFFSYIPDHYILFDDLTGREYVNYVADLYNIDIDSRRKYTNYYLRKFRLTNSFDSKISTYSFGMKQKITIISSLICQPKIWLLDEPLTGLDPDSIIQIKQCIKEHASKGNIVLFSSHLIDVVEELANRIIILKKGKVIYDASKEKAMKTYKNNLNNLYIDKVGAVN